MRLVKVLDGETVLAEAPFARRYGASYELRLRVESSTIAAPSTTSSRSSSTTSTRPYHGAVAFVCEEGRCDERISVRRVG